MRAYYNEHDAKKAAWLRELIADGQITRGDVDERPIEHVRPGDLRGYTRRHFFAGIGVWDYALDLAGWGNEPVWTGSCPCPSFSCAGQGQGFDDPRHLWPAWFGLIRECRPPVVFGEQADDAIGFGWLDLVQHDLEGEAYAVGKAVLGACSVGAPHIRQRLYFAAQSENDRHEWRGPAWRGRHGSDNDCVIGCMADTESRGQREQRSASRRARYPDERERIGKLGDAGGEGLSARERGIVPGQDGHREGRAAMQSGSSPWATVECEWLPCKDGKLRPVEPVPAALADGVADFLGSVRYQGGRIFHPLQVKAPARRLRLHGYGDAIVSRTAAEFIRAFMETQ